MRLPDAPTTWPYGYAAIGGPVAAPPDAEAVALAERVARLACAARCPADTGPEELGQAEWDLLDVVRYVGRYRPRETLVGGALIGAALFGGDPVRRHLRDACMAARWVAPHVGRRPCALARRVGRVVRIVFVLPDGRIHVIRTNHEGGVMP